MKTPSINNTVDQYVQWLATNPTLSQIRAYLVSRGRVMIKSIANRVGKNRSCLWIADAATKGVNRTVKPSQPIGSELWKVRVSQELIDTKIHIKNLMKQESLEEEVWAVNSYNLRRDYVMAKIQEEIEAEMFLQSSIGVLINK